MADNEGADEFDKVEETFLYNIPGRKPKDPMKKIGSSNRFLSTIAIERLLTEVAEKAPYNFQKSDYIRLAVLEQLYRDGLLTAEVLADPSWDTLRLSQYTAKRMSELAKEVEGK